LKERMEADIDDVLKVAQAIKRQIEALDRANLESRKTPGCEEGTGTDRTRMSITTTMKRKLKELMNEFQDLRSKFQSEYREVVERRYYTVTGKRADSETIDTLIETGDSESIFQKAIQEQGRGQLMDTLAEIQERHSAVQDIEKQLLELHQIFMDMAVLVESQGELLDNIEVQVGQAVDHVQHGTKQLVEARKTQLNTRKWICCGIILVIVIIVVIIIVVSSLSKLRLLVAELAAKRRRCKAITGLSVANHHRNPVRAVLLPLSLPPHMAAGGAGSSDRPVPREDSPPDGGDGGGEGGGALQGGGSGDGAESGAPDYIRLTAAHAGEDSGGVDEGDPADSPDRRAAGGGEEEEDDGEGAGMAYHERGAGGGDWEGVAAGELESHEPDRDDRHRARGAAAGGGGNGGDFGGDHGEAEVEDGYYGGDDGGADRWGPGAEAEGDAEREGEGEDRWVEQGEADDNDQEMGGGADDDGGGAEGSGGGGAGGGDVIEGGMDGDDGGEEGEVVGGGEEDDGGVDEERDARREGGVRAARGGRGGEAGESSGEEEAGVAQGEGEAEQGRWGERERAAGGEGEEAEGEDESDDDRDWVGEEEEEDGSDGGGEGEEEGEEVEHEEGEEGESEGYEEGEAYGGGEGEGEEDDEVQEAEGRGGGEEEEEDEEEEGGGEGEAEEGEEEQWGGRGGCYVVSGDRAGVGRGASRQAVHIDLDDDEDEEGEEGEGGQRAEGVCDGVREVSVRIMEPGEEEGEDEEEESAGEGEGQGGAEGVEAAGGMGGEGGMEVDGAWGSDVGDAEGAGFEEFLGEMARGSGGDGEGGAQGGDEAGLVRMSGEGAAAVEELEGVEGGGEDGWGGDEQMAAWDGAAGGGEALVLAEAAAPAAAAAVAAVPVAARGGDESAALTAAAAAAAAASLAPGESLEDGVKAGASGAEAGGSGVGGAPESVAADGHGLPGKAPAILAAAAGETGAVSTEGAGASAAEAEASLSGLRPPLLVSHIFPSLTSLCFVPCPLLSFLLLWLPPMCAAWPGAPEEQCARLQQQVASLEREAVAVRESGKEREEQRRRAAERAEESIRVQMKRCHELELQVLHLTKRSTEAEARAAAAEARAVAAEARHARAEEEVRAVQAAREREVAGVRAHMEGEIARLEAEVRMGVSRMEAMGVEMESLEDEADALRAQHAEAVREAADVRCELERVRGEGGLGKSTSAVEAHALLARLQEDNRRLVLWGGKGRRGRRDDGQGACGRWRTLLHSPALHLAASALVPHGTRGTKAEGAEEAREGVAVAGQGADEVAGSGGGGGEGTGGGREYGPEDVVAAIGKLQSAALCAMAEAGEAAAQVVPLRAAVAAAERAAQEARAGESDARRQLVQLQGQLDGKDSEMAVVVRERDSLRCMLQSYDDEEQVVAHWLTTPRTPLPQEPVPPAMPLAPHAAAAGTADCGGDGDGAGAERVDGRLVTVTVPGAAEGGRVLAVPSAPHAAKKRRLEEVERALHVERGEVQSREVALRGVAAERDRLQQEVERLKGEVEREVAKRRDAEAELQARGR
ncbi:unnamed protein product, partial [Closterium sp. Yama58-4]